MPKNAPARRQPASRRRRPILQAFSGDSRPLNEDELKAARLVIRRWRAARNCIAKLYGSADESPEFQEAWRLWRKAGGDYFAYRRSFRKEADMIATDDLESYARFRAGPNGTLDHATWNMLYNSERDLINIIIGLDHEERWDHWGAPSLTIGGRRYTAHPDEFEGCEGFARLTVEDVRSLATAAAS